MKKFLANIFWNLAIFNIKIATKLAKIDRATMTRIIEKKGTTITLSDSQEYAFGSGDKVLIVK